MSETPDLMEVMKLANDLITIHDTGEVLSKVLHTIARFSGAERGYVVRVKNGRMVTGAVYPKAGKGQTEMIAMSKTAIEAAITTKKILKGGGLWPFSPSKSIHDLGVKALLCIPLVFKGEILGVVYLHHTQNRETFDDVPIPLLETLAGYAAIAITNAELYQQAITDPMTGLYSHRYFETCVERELQRCARISKPVSIIFLDIDHFKKVNDKYGHETGSALIRELGAIITTVVRRTDLVVRPDGGQMPENAAARYGGDEFEIMLSEAPKEGAQVVAKRLMAVVGAQPFEVGGKEIPLTLSVGIATFPDDAKDAQELLRCADDAMYEAKKQGRGRVYTYRAR
jgi:diguanylate cyclase (GGDEF)-like protein